MHGPARTSQPAGHDRHEGRFAGAGSPTARGWGHGWSEPEIHGFLAPRPAAPIPRPGSVPGAGVCGLHQESGTMTGKPFSPWEERLDLCSELAPSGRRAEGDFPGQAVEPVQNRKSKCWDLSSPTPADFACSSPDGPECLR